MEHQGRAQNDLFRGENESPAKLPREGSSKYDASQQLKHTANMLNTPYDERNNFEVIREQTSLDLDYMDSDLWISAGISELEATDISREGRWFDQMTTTTSSRRIAIGIFVLNSVIEIYH